MKQRRYLPEKPCELCGKPFHPRADAKPEYGRFCSRSCGAKHRRSLRQPWGEVGHTFIERYVLIRMPSHPAAKKNGYVYEHRLVMEQHLGRRLTPKEHVHHINGDKLDNRIENLELMTVAEHLMEHRPAFEAKRKEAAFVASRAFLKRVAVACAHCGAPLERTPSSFQPKRRVNAYCNRDCYRQSRAKMRALNSSARSSPAG